MDFYPTLITLAVALSAGSLARRCGALPALTHTLILTLAAVMCGRMGYVALNLEYFRGHPWEIAQLAQTGGLSAHGALLGALAAHTMRRTARGWDTLLPLALLGSAASLGCIAHGCGHGRELFWTDGPWWRLAVDWPDLSGIANPRLPAQLFLTGWLATALAGAYALRWRPSPISAAAMFAAGDCLVQFSQADAMPVIAGLRSAQWIDIAILCAAAAVAGARLTAGGMYAAHARTSVSNRDAQT